MFDVFMRYPGYKSKAVTLSFDDGTEQDEKFIQILNKYNLKATFNVNSGLFAPKNVIYPESQVHRRLSKSKIIDTYLLSGHELALHSLNHKFLDILSESQILYEVLQDRNNLEKLTDSIIRGFAYPYGRTNSSLQRILSSAGILYARGVGDTMNFDLPDNLLNIIPTCHYKNNEIDVLINRFCSDSPLNSYHARQSWLFYIWGHSFEFDRDCTWKYVEEMMEKISKRDDVWYATNADIFSYIESFRKLIFSLDGRIVYNPTSTRVFFECCEKCYVIDPGITMRLNYTPIKTFVLNEK